MRYQMRRRMLSFGGRYDICTESSRIAWTAHVRALAWGTTIDLAAGDGRRVARLRRRVLGFPATWDLRRTDGIEDAVIRRGLRFVSGSIRATDASGRVFNAEGDFLAREYVIESAGEVVALVSKRFFSLRNQYGIELSREGDEPDPRDLVPIAVALVIDRARRAHTA